MSKHKEVNISWQDQMQMMEEIALSTGESDYDLVRDYMYVQLRQLHGNRAMFNMEEIAEKDMKSFLEWLSEQQMKDNKWHSGPPPSVGWWPASASIFPEDGLYRWFDGDMWGAPAFPEYCAVEAAKCAAYKCRRADEVKWKHRPDNWPERSKT